MRSSTLLAGALASLVLAGVVRAQDEASRERQLTRVIRMSGDEDRAALGITTSSGSKRDTLGLLITNITPGGPADKAGLMEGDRIAAVNGVKLTLAPSDAGESDMDGILTNRLIRELHKVKPGDEVQLQLYSGGKTRTVKVKTTDMDELTADRRHAVDEDELENRAVVGLEFGGGSRRDSLGLLVTRVVPDGPAEKAGIIEGNRVASVNGVDLRVPADEAEDGDLIWAKQQRFTRELQKVKAGDAVELEVYADGNTKKVRVTTAAAKDVYPHDGRRVRVRIGDGSFDVTMPRFAPMPPVPPLPPVPPSGSEIMVVPRGGWDGRVIDLDRMNEQMQRSIRESERAMRDAQRATQRRLQELQERELPRLITARAAAWPRAATFWGSGAGMHDLGFGGLRVTDVSDDLADYFGKGSEKGLLVLEADESWAPLRAGDVILSHDGKSVRNGKSAELSIDTDHDNRFEILRKQKRMTVTVNAH